MGVWKDIKERHTPGVKESNWPLLEGRLCVRGVCKTTREPRTADGGTRMPGHRL